MNTNNNPTEKLFSYGTLQLSTFGRRLQGVRDVLVGYHLSHITITDADVVNTSGTATHPMLTFTGNEEDVVTGVVFDISAQELQQADVYEVKDYQRVSVQLRSGTRAWVYVSRLQDK